MRSAPLAQRRLPRRARATCHLALPRAVSLVRLPPGHSALRARRARPRNCVCAVSRPTVGRDRPLRRTGWYFPIYVAHTTAPPTLNTLMASTTPIIYQQKNRYLTESNQNRRRSGRGRKRPLLPESYNVEKVISWRQRAGGIELLIAWEGYDVDGWTWEPLDNIPERFVRAFHAQRQRLPPSFFYVVTMMRDRIGFKLLERTGPMFGVAVLVEEAALREYALALLQYFSTPRQRRTSWLCTRRRRSSSRGRRSLSGTACALAAGATS